MVALDWTALAVIILYFAVMIWLSGYFMRFVRSSNDYWIAGRTLGPWVVAFSYGATYYSSVAMVSGIIYLGGLGYASWDALGCAWLFALLPFAVIGAPLRRTAERLNAVTMPGWIGERFGSSACRVYAAILVTAMTVPYSAAILKGIGHVMETVVGMPYNWAVVILGLITGIYVTMSGFFGVAWTDLIQGIVIFAGLLLIVPRALAYAGGLSGVVSSLKSADVNLVSIPGSFSWGDFLTWTLVWGLTCWGAPQLITRFYALKDQKLMGRTMVIATAWSAIVIILMYAVGITARAVWPTDYVNNPDVANAALVKLVAPPLLAAIFCSALLAAAMSTLDSIFLVAASALARDLYEDVYLKKSGRQISQKAIIQLSRLATIVIMGLGILFALFPPGIIHKLATFNAGVNGAAFGAVVIYGVFWKRANWQGCLASMIAGTVTTLIWYVTGWPLYPYFPGIIAAAIALPLVSMLTTPPSESLVERVYGASTSKSSGGIKVGA